MRYGIVGTGSHIPTRVVSNDELAAGLPVSADWISDRTGVHERRFAAGDEATSDLATVAARRALADAGITPDQVDLIVVGTSTPDQPQPATGAFVQQRLGAVHAAAFDVNSVCTSFLFALDTARGLLQADPNRRFALVIGADVYSRILNDDDHRSCVLFGDGAGAVVLGPVGDDEGVLSSTLVTDGRLSDIVEVPGGGSRLPLSDDVIAAGEHLFTMQGREVRSYVEQVVPEVLGDLLKAASLALEDIDLVVPHQANAVLLRNTFDAAGVDPEKVALTCPVYGNTAAASIPLTLDEAVRERDLQPGALIALVGVGGGMSAGGTLLRWSAPGTGVPS